MSQNLPHDTPSQPAGPQNEAEGPLARFRRTVTEASESAKNYLGHLGSSNSTSQPSTPKPDETPQATAHPSKVDTLQPGHGPAKPTAFERFMSLGKVRKDWEVEWPPSHWVDAAGQQSPASDAPAMPDTVAENPTLQDQADPSPEPYALAEKIRSMIANSPPPSFHNAEGTSKAPPAPPTLVTDAQMVSYLSSPAVMNGSPSKGGQSVWTSLDRLRAVFPGQSKDIKPPADAPQGTADHRQEEVLEDDESGVMVYAPLIPTDSSEVELAQSEIVPEPQSSQHDGPSSTRVHFHGGKAKKVWVPSPDKISVQVMWWGYRIYLPPPVLEILDNKSLEGAKRAALLTTALKWALDRVPMMVLPPPARPAMKVFKTFAPYLGYVGSFVAWSWGSVKKFDKGHGVTLTATWLLTIAVIPGTWEENDHPSTHPSDVEKQPVPSSTSEAGAIPQAPKQSS